MSSTIQNPTEKEIIEAMKEFDKKDSAFWNNLSVKFSFDGKTFVKTHLGSIVSEIPLNMLYINSYGVILPKKEWIQRK